MSSSKRSRFIVVAGIIVIVIIAATAFLSAGTTATVMTVEQAASPAAQGKRVQVEGTVVDNSFAIDGDTLTFAIMDEKSESGAPELRVLYDKGVAATFGNGVIAICTGIVDDQGVLQASELVTKCPSKYETSTDALTVSRLMGYGANIIDKPVKVTGAISDSGIADVSASSRFALVDEDGTLLEVVYTGAIPDGVAEQSMVVMTGSLGADGRFTATDLAIESSKAR